MYSLISATTTYSEKVPDPMKLNNGSAEQGAPFLVIARIRLLLSGITPAPD